MRVSWCEDWRFACKACSFCGTTRITALERKRRGREVRAHQDARSVLAGIQKFFRVATHLIASCTYMYLLPSCNKTLLQTLIGEYKKLKKNVKSSESAVTGESAGVEGRVGVTSSFAQQRREIGVATSNGQKRSNDAN